ncbi:MAG: hypothetical protein QF546_03920 [Alphaproteobacteria bacterium]|jgi:hypothetical protein|nr:hypothetical protein [Alphaproteobacteria bacterium]HJP22376.1 hypothetical protein [Alphaproteobacteria bacterium]
MVERGTFLGAVLVLLLGLSGTANAANIWGLPAEEKVRFEARVVDILCELSGNCPTRCGAGKRQLGLLRDDGTLVLAMKNAGMFSGASEDLLPFCGRRIVADGLFSTNFGVRVFALQFLKPVDGEWNNARQFIRNWSKTRGLKITDPKAKSWFRHDEKIKAVIAEQGPTGLKGRN